MTTPLPAGKGYFAASPSPRYSILFALPLLIAYEGLAAILSRSNGGVRNGADALLKGLFTAAAGVYGPAILMAGVILLGVYLVARDMRRTREPLKSSYFAGMAAESV